MARQRRRTDSPAAAPNWAQLSVIAEGALRYRLGVARELAPRAVAETVAGVLPRYWKRRLLRQLARWGWLQPNAPILFDALDDPRDFPHAGVGWSTLLRLAVFGLPGQGLAYRDKHRQDIFQQLCAEIMASAVDTASLNAVASRALSHPEAVADPVLSSMLRAFIAQREAALRARLTPAEEHQRSEQTSKLRRPFERPILNPSPSRDDIVAALARLQRQFDGELAQFEERAAQGTLDKLRELRRRYPAHVPAEGLQRCEEQFDRLLKRAGTYRRQIRELAEQGAQAAQEGDTKKAAWIVRRLEAVHTLLPNLLPADQLQALRQEIARRADEHDLLEVRHELAQKQQEVAAKIKNLAGIIQRFHQLAQRLPPTDEAYRRAEANYRWAVAQIRAMDTDWLSGLVVQLETLIADLDDRSGQMQTQLDRFITSVRTALNRLCLEIRAHQRERGMAPRDRPPPPPGSADPPGS